MNLAVLTGRLVRDPELRYIAHTGTPVATFTLAVDRGLSKQKKQEMKANGYPTADFINIVAWNKLAETVANYAKKGKLVAVQGSIRTRSYEAKDNSTRYVTEVFANKVEILEWSNSQNNDFGNFNPDDYVPDGFEPTDDIDDNIPF